MRAAKHAPFYSRPSPWIPRKPRSSVADRTTSFFEPLPSAVGTNADTESPITRDDSADNEAPDHWQRLIDHELMEWASDPTKFDDDGIEPPSEQIVRLAIALAEHFRDQGLPAPDSVVPDPNGGIVFERRENGLCEVFHVWDDGTVEYQRFQGTRLVERRPLQLETLVT